MPPMFGVTVVTPAGQVMLGGVVSTTVTIALHWVDTPWLSVNVSVTVVLTRAYGHGGDCVSLIVSPGSGSNEPASIEALAMQSAPADTVTFLHLAIGGVSTTTVAIAMLPVPPLLEATAPLTLFFVPGVAPVTVTL